MPLHQRQKLTLLFILLSATLVRTLGFITQSPPGPEHDEVANWLIDRAILAGEHAVYFTQAYGHEAGFHYWQTLFVWLVGDNLLALRAPAALMGVLSVAVTYALNRRLFGRNAALIIAAIIAVLFMPVFYSRLALRAISLPVTAGLCACFFWDWLKTGRRLFLILAAVFAGLSSYTYLASRALPIFFIGWFFALALLYRLRVGHTWKDWVTFGATYFLVSLPLILFLINPANVETRVGEVDGPLQALLAGDVRPVLQNGLAILAGFGFSGDPLWRQGVAFQPIFEPLFAILFYLGLITALLKIRDIRYSFILFWLGASVIPSVVTIDAPSTIRMILMLPVTATFPIVGLEQIFNLFGISLISTEVPKNSKVFHSFPQLSTRKGELSTTKLNFAWVALLTAACLVFYASRTMRDIYQTWPNSTEVQFVWQQALTEIGRDIDQDVEITEVSIAGWTPDTMDDPTMELVIQRSDVERRHFGRIGSIETVVIPADNHTIYRPTDLPFDPALEEWLLQSYQSTTQGSFTRYTPLGPADFDLLGSDVTMTHLQSGNELTFVGYQPIKTESVEIELITVWQVGAIPAPAEANTKLFLHLVDADGNLLAQHDGLDASHRFWQDGDWLVQLHTLPQQPGAAEMRLGAYVGAEPWPRFVQPSGQDVIVIPLP